MVTLNKCVSCLTVYLIRRGFGYPKGARCPGGFYTPPPVAVREPQRINNDPWKNHMAAETNAI